MTTVLAPPAEPLSMVSFGGGVNSVAMTISLVNRGWRGPIVFSDTGTEWPETYCYMDYFGDWLASYGLSLTRISTQSHLRPPSERFSLLQYCQNYNIFPTAMARWCTAKWKVQPLDRWAKQNHIESVMLGIAADEAHRQKGRDCPLVDRGITRAGCVDIIEAEGLEVPQRSGCYICWAQGIAQWRQLHKRHKECYSQAAALERQVQDSKGIRFTFLRNGPSLDVLGERFSGETEMPGFGDELSPYLPCLCGL